MAWTKVQSDKNDGGFGNQLAFPGAVTAGNLLVVEAGSDLSDISVSDSEGHHVWNLIDLQADSSTDQRVSLHYAIAAVSEAVTIVESTAGGFRSIIVQEWAHTGGGAISLDQHAKNAVAGTNPVTSSITPTGADALVLALCGQNINFFSFADEVESPFTIEDTVSLSTTSNDGIGIASYQQASPAAISATFNYSGSGANALVIASFLAAGGEPVAPFSSVTLRGT